MNELQMRPMATDPVCGMQVNPDLASAQGLTAEHEGQSYYFCGRGCRLDFADDPAKYLAEGYQPSM
jgi:YHS domain-containing protein